MISFYNDDYRRSPMIGVWLLLLIKSVLFRFFLFGEVQGIGLLADAAAWLGLLLIVELITAARWRGIAYWAVNLIVSVLLFASTIYFSYYGSVPTYTALKALDQVNQIQDSVESLIKSVYYIYFLDLAILAILYIVRLVRGTRVPGRKRFGQLRIVLGGLLVCIAVSGTLVYAGNDIPNELEQAEGLGFIGYQAAAAWENQSEKAMASSGDIEQTKVEIEALMSSYSYQDQQGKTPIQFGSAQGKNVIVVQMEAFQNFPIHLTVGGMELTPVLNKLADESYYFPHIYQQIGQGNTSDAEFMSNTSIYPTGEIAMSTGFANRELPSMPRMLESKGYEANTFHVNDVTFWDRDKLYPALGFKHYYDKPFYTNDHFNEFGASDEELYRVAVDKLQALHEQNKPFYAQMVTVSSHFPFEVPKDRTDLNLPASLEGTQLGNYLEAVHYTDYALGTLIDRLKANGMWDDTVLVAYGDHFGLQPEKASAEEISQQLGIHYDDRLSRFNIPLIMHVPGQSSGQVVDQPGGQLDIMPTLANLLGVKPADEGVVAFGHDLLNIDHNVFGMRYYLPTGSFFNNDILFVPGKGFDDGTAYSIKTMEPVQNFSQYRNDYDYIMKLMSLSDQYVRQLPKRAP
ncbi:Phosphoglycerol transferase MdoB [Paenibacillus catalpae]|uniref:Phosphoglycerol transferase MdoB n=2 Tax=Paenibacillus catalpae TaxID=1045775 RepID=A0A1I2ABX8_9BACL|nr:Phosphoglycerol transferase MdoB [Paenibacillus catalpae]